MTNNGVTITTGQTSPVLSYKAAADSSNPNDYQIIVSRSSYATAAVNSGFSSNQQAVASSLDGLLGTNGPINANASTLLNKIDNLSTSQYQAVLKSLSPERLGASAQVSTLGGNQFNDSLFNLIGQIHSGTANMASLSNPNGMLADASSSNDAADANAIKQADEKYHGLNVFFHPFGAYGSRDAEVDRTGYNFYNDGLIGGVETRINDHWIAGVSLGYLHSKVNYDSNAGDTHADTIRGGLFAGGTWDPWYVDASLSSSYQWNHSTRNIVSPLTSSSNADYGSWAASVATEVGVHLPIKNTQATVTPFAGIYYTYFHQNGFQETNSALPAAAMAMNSADSNYLRSDLGARLSYDMTLVGHRVTPSVSAGWLQSYLNDNSLSGRFVDSSTGFTVQSGVGRQSGVAFDAAINAQVKSNVWMNVRYSGEVNAHSHANVFSANLTITF